MGKNRGISMLFFKSLPDLDTGDDIFVSSNANYVDLEVPRESDTMLSAEYLSSFHNIIQSYTEGSDIHKNAILEIKSKGATLVLNASNATDSVFMPELFYRHSMAMTTVYCVAYLLVFALGLVGNFFVIAVVFRSPRMRTVTNFFIVNLAIADILVVMFCLPATLMSNIFVRKYHIMS
ncbi:hypothetical protein JTB14_026922 [Gonioctena quinquepunctata]|nr:hypothetical protein JTB14_026922 [Gonioctena quinquepunctata]